MADVKKKEVAKATVSTKKATNKNAVSKKTAVKKSPAKKATVTKKPVAKKLPAKKSASSKNVAKKVSTKKKNALSDCVVISVYHVEIVDKSKRFLRSVNEFNRYKDALSYVVKNELTNDGEKYRIIRDDHISEGDFFDEESFNMECVYGECF